MCSSDLINLAFNLLVPTLVLTKLSGEDFLGIKLAIVVALAFPIIYGLHDFFTRGKLNFFSALGVVSVTLTGGISLLGSEERRVGKEYSSRGASCH
mgnify:CR=1 FL=1